MNGSRHTHAHAHAHAHARAHAQRCATDSVRTPLAGLLATHGMSKGECRGLGQASPEAGSAGKGPKSCGWGWQQSGQRGWVGRKPPGWQPQRRPLRPCQCCCCSWRQHRPGWWWVWEALLLGSVPRVRKLPPSAAPGHHQGCFRQSPHTHVTVTIPLVSRHFQCFCRERRLALQACWCAFSHGANWLHQYAMAAAGLQAAAPPARRTNSHKVDGGLKEGQHATLWLVAWESLSMRRCRNSK